MTDRSRYTLIWTQGAVDDYKRGAETKRLLAHRISKQPLDVIRTLENQIPDGTARIILSEGKAQT